MRRVLVLLAGLSIPATLALGGCSSSDVPAEETGAARSPERWDNRNNPVFVDSAFVYAVDKLPLEGQTKIAPVPSDYWATYKDSVNVRWDGEDSLSPAEKYEKAFGKPGLALAVSQSYGIRAQTFRKECTKEDAACSDLKDGSACSIPRGETKGRCIPTWWGICPGWSSAAYMEPPPRKPVTKNGVTFFPGDLEALMALVYDKSRKPQRFIGGRCNLEEKDIPLDNNGRVNAPECRDLNPGALHVILTNKLGIRHEGFVVERTASLQIWNQPARGFKVENAEGGKLKEITKAEAIALVGADLAFAEVVPETALKKDETKTGTWTATAAGEVTFRTAGTGDVDLFVVKGEGASATHFDCKSEGSGSTESCKLKVQAGDKVSYTVLAFADSKASLSVGTATSTTSYSLNPSAARFFHVVMDMKWISEARPARTSHVDEVDLFTRTDRIEYVLETDAAGRIQGGEYLGDSRLEHPDFAWWPTAKPVGRLPAVDIAYEDVKALNDEAADLAQH